MVSIKINDKIINFRIKPYIEEAVLQIILDMVILAIVTIIFIIARFPVGVCLAVDVGYFVVAIIFHYRVVILALTDKRKSDYITETVSIKSFIEEYSFTGDRFGHSNVHLFYPKEMQVGKYKLKVVDDKCEEKKLRSVMSFRRVCKFTVFDYEESPLFKVTYLKSSKIIINIEFAEDIDNLKSKRKKEEFKKALNYINMYI